MIQRKAKISVVPARLTCGKFLPEPRSANQIKHFRETWRANVPWEGVPTPPSPRLLPIQHPTSHPAAIRNTWEHSWPDVRLRNHFSSTPADNWMRLSVSYSHGLATELQVLRTS